MVERWKSNLEPMTNRLTVCHGCTDRETQSETRCFRVPGGRLNTGESNQGRGQQRLRWKSYKITKSRETGTGRKLKITQLKIRTIKTKQEAQTNRSYQFILVWCPADSFTNLLRLIMPYFRAWSEKKKKKKDPPGFLYQNHFPSVTKFRLLIFLFRNKIGHFSLDTRNIFAPYFLLSADKTVLRDVG